MMTLVLVLTACGAPGAGGRAGNEAEKLLTGTRNLYLDMAGCSGHADLTADYGERVYNYGVDFTWEKEGETLLTITAPENIAGTTARIHRGETALEYDGVMMATGPLDAAGLTPIDALPALLEYAREGFLAECALEDDGSGQRLRVVCRDPEDTPGTGVEAQLWFAPDTGFLLRGEISESGFTVIQCNFTAFAIQALEEG